MAQGRPKKESFMPVFSVSRKRWLLDIPASVSGKRQKRYFKSQAAALEVAATIARSIEMGQEVSLPVPKVQGGNTIKALAASYIAARDGQTSAGNLKAASWGLGFLSEKFGDLKPEELTPHAINSWIANLPDLSTRGKFNVFSVGRTFFSSPLMRDLVAINPFRDAPTKKEKGSRLEILTPEEMAIILKLPLQSFFKSWIVGGGFGGVRTVEYDRLSHEAFDWAHKEIVVRRQDSKQGEAARPRSITIEPALERHMPRGTGALNEGKWRYDFQKEMAKLLPAIGRQAWPKNALRHSFATYHLAHFQDPIKTAYNMGHVTSQMIYEIYANSVSRVEAAAWWNL